MSLDQPSTGNECRYVLATDRTLRWCAEHVGDNHRATRPVLITFLVPFRSELHLQVEVLINERPFFKLRGMFQAP